MLSVICFAGIHQQGAEMKCGSTMSYKTKDTLNYNPCSIGPMLTSFISCIHDRGKPNSSPLQHMCIVSSFTSTLLSKI